MKTLHLKNKQRSFPLQLGNTKYEYVGECVKNSYTMCFICSIICLTPSSDTICGLQTCRLILVSVFLFSVTHMHIKMYCCFPDKNIATKK